MKRRSCLSFSLALIALGGVLIASPASGMEDSAAQYFPLTVGNRWVYESTEYPDDRVTDESWEVLREEEDALVVRVIPGSLGGNGFELFFVPTPSGIRRSMYEPDLLDNTIPKFPFILKSPSPAGATWRNKEGHFGVTAIDKKLIVPAGTFQHCVEITYKNTSETVTIVTHYAPGVGVVMRNETFPHVEGSFSIHPTLKDRVVLKLKEWQVAASGS